MKNPYQVDPKANPNLVSAEQMARAYARKRSLWLGIVMTFLGVAILSPFVFLAVRFWIFPVGIHFLLVFFSAVGLVLRGLWLIFSAPFRRSSPD